MMMYDRDGNVIDHTDEAEMKRVWDRDYRLVASTNVGKAHISTVLLVIDHGWREGEKPVIFETMVFDYERPRTLWQRLARKQPQEREYQWRYHTLDEATEGHLCVHKAVENRTLDEYADFA